MHSFAYTRLAGTFALSMSALTLAGCEQSETPTEMNHVAAHADNAPVFSSARGEKPGAMFLAARKSTSRFHSTKQAIAAGHVPDAHCVSRPLLGGMGQHWVNQSIVDPVFDPSRPEAALYEPSGDNKVKLVAVEYIVIDVGQPRPSFDGQLFDVGGVPPLMAEDVPHWSLHVWVHRDNPSGLYAPFNPDVSCN